MRAPTDEEIEYAFNAITQDGVGAKITTDLSLLAASNPYLRAGVKKRVQDSIVVLNTTSPRFGLHAIIAGALIYGIHLGMHLMEFRIRHRKEKDAPITHD